MTMAVAEPETLEQTPGSRHLHLGLSSLLGAAFLLFCVGFVLGGVPSMWESALGIQKAIEAGETPVLNEFLSDALLLMVMIVAGVGLVFLLRALERSSAQPGLRAGIVFGAFGLYVFLGLATKLGWAMTPDDTGEFNLLK